MRSLALTLLLFSAGSQAGTLTKEQLQAEVRQHLREVNRCFEERIRRMPGSKGTLVIEWSVDELGAATKINIVAAKTTLQGAPTSAIKSCIVDLFKAWLFSRAPKGEEVSASFTFKFSDHPPFLISK